MTQEKNVSDIMADRASSEEMDHWRAQGVHADYLTRPYMAYQTSRQELMDRVAVRPLSANLAGAILQAMVKQEGGPQ